MLPDTIIRECSQFLSETNGTPLIRTLPIVGEGFRKVKLRKRNRYTEQSEVFFDKAFSDRQVELRLRSMIAHSIPPVDIADELELFYVFPINGYKILYNKNVNDYREYASTLAPIIATSVAEELLTQLFEYTYEDDDINDAILAGAEILIYNISYYYAVRASLYGGYDDLVSNEELTNTHLRVTIQGN